MLFLLGADVALAALSAALILRKDAPCRADHLLAASLGAAGLLCALVAANVAGLPAPRLIYIFAGGSGFLVPPALFHLYIREAAGRTRALDLLWLAPAAAHFAAMAAIDLTPGPPSLSFTAGFAVIETRGAWPLALAPAPAIVFILLMAAGLRDLRAHDAALKARFADIDRLALDWARTLLQSALAVTVASAAAMALAAWTRALPAEAMLAFVLVLLGLFFAIVAAHAPSQMRAPPMAEPAAPPDERAPAPGLDVAAVRATLRQGELFVKEDLRLDDVARALGRPAREVSAAISAGSAGSFYDLVNALRAERAGALLADPDYADVSILAIALDAGFQSKATFNRVFKSATGLTPSQFRERREGSLRAGSAPRTNRPQ